MGHGENFLFECRSLIVSFTQIVALVCQISNQVGGGGLKVLVHSNIYFKSQMSKLEQTNFAKVLSIAKEQHKR